MDRGDRQEDIFVNDVYQKGSNRSLDHERAVVTYVPRTTSRRDTRFEVPHQAGSFESGAFDAQGLGSVPTVKLAGLWGGASR
jgi:mRNA-degrading endonuclease toxin of MazEF toxin-antitoxin module